MPEPVKRYTFAVEDTRGEFHQLMPEGMEFVGTYYEAAHNANHLANAWEISTKNEVAQLFLESRGNASCSVPT